MHPTLCVHKKVIKQRSWIPISIHLSIKNFFHPLAPFRNLRRKHFSNKIIRCIIIIFVALHTHTSFSGMILAVMKCEEYRYNNGSTYAFIISKFSVANNVVSLKKRVEKQVALNMSRRRVGYCSFYISISEYTGLGTQESQHHSLVCQQHCTGNKKTGVGIDSYH